MMIFLAESAKHLKRNFKKLRVRIGRHESYRFADGERGYRLRDGVSKKQAALVASVLPDPESLFELFALDRLVIENGASRAARIIPYLGYARQDRPSRKGEASIGIMTAELLQRASASEIILVDVHSPRVRQAFGPSMTEVTALSLFAGTFSKRPPDVIVSPDAGSIMRAENFAKLITPAPEVAIIEKVRPRPNVAIAKRLHGDVRGKRVLILDDMIDTGKTLDEAVKVVSRKGATKIVLAATHGIFSKNARERLLHLPIEEILITNTLPQIRRPGIRVLDIVPLLLQALNRS